MNALCHADFDAAVGPVTEHEAAVWGFRLGDKGTHSSRTIMFEELSHLMEAAPGDVSLEDYAEAIMARNCLGKRTIANRKISLQHLRELYSLDPRVVLFRVLRELWDRDRSSRVLLALMLSLVRDPLLRASAPAVLGTPPGHEFARQPMTDAVKSATGDRLNSATLDKVVRNAASSWTQSGHLRGRGRKTRQRVQATPVATTYALMIGFATNRRGRLLFETPWCSILDTDIRELIDLAVAARTLGLLEFKQSGSIIDVSFADLLKSRHRC